MSDGTSCNTSYYCANCQADNSRHSCSACLVTKYCSKDCQKAHWKTHKPQCKVLQQEREAEAEAATMTTQKREKRKECCVNCQAENAVEHCSSCMITKYCSAECQKAHWKIHKPLCKFLSDPENVSRNLAAKKGIKKGIGSVSERLYIACMLGRLAEAEKLIADGADVNYFNDNGGSCLLLAAQGGHLRVAQLLLSRGARVNRANNNGVTPLRIAVQQGHKEVVSLLLENHAHVDLADNKGVTPLFIAAQEGRTEVVSLLLEKHAQVDLANNNGFTPLLMAAHCGHIEVVRLLLQAGADPSVSVEGFTPLETALYFNHPEVAALLQARITEIQGQPRRR